MVRHIEYFANVIAFGALILWTMHLLYADWSWNIVHDFLFARVNGPVFFYDHAFSFLALAATGWFLVVDDRFNKPWRQIIAVSAVVSIHELAVEFVATVLRFGAFDIIYSAIMIFILILTFKCSREQKEALFFIAVFLIVYQTVVPFAFRRFGESVNGFLPTEHFFDPVTNLLEILSWLVPFSILIGFRFIYRSMIEVDRRKIG